ncbi:hypothetical protein BpHYR1_002642 [Brachionus plicatilis]|uniref:Uncharacterized protein n=1 Tax=Brachionus plicatilis TaxID=10195 RepID=A0A3M7QRV5_BRAPC|nr:hypothetical protein BpHYR1_002642 [Brachionus plicatilis]
MLSDDNQVYADKTIQEHSNNIVDEQDEDNELFSNEENCIISKYENLSNTKISEFSFCENNDRSESINDSKTSDDFLYSDSNILVSEFLDLFLTIKRIRFGIRCYFKIH